MKTRIDIYTAEIPQNIPLSTLYPPAREEEISACKNEKVRREKYCVWKLLEYAVERSLGKKLNGARFTKTPSGKWQSPLCEFSLSHSKNAVAVAISTQPVGVDIEIFRPEKLQGLAEKFLTPPEFAVYENTERKAEYLFEKWTQKESIFKRLGDCAVPAFRIDSENFSTLTREIEIAGERYFLSVSAEDIQTIRFHETQL